MNLRPKMNLFGVAGWLFADLLLVLTIVGFGSSSYFDPQLLNSPPEKLQDKILVLSPEPKVVTLEFNAVRLRSRDEEEIASIHSQLLNSEISSRNSSGGLAGIVMTFSGGDSCARVFTGSETSLVINEYLRKWFPSYITETSVLKPYLDGNCSKTNTAKIEIYELVTKKEKRQ